MTNEEAIRIATGLRTDFKCESDTMVDFCNTVIKALEQTRWIPCSERLPEVMDGTNGECSDDVLICVADDERITISTGFYGYYPESITQQGWWCVWAYGCCQLDSKYKVLAWMPQPKPYKAERHTCGECQEWGTVNCSETYREPTKNDDVCESFKADREVVIKIPEEIMEYIKNNGCLSVIYNSEIASAIANGTPLPKGHGRLIDVDEIPIDCDYYDVDNASTIIEADAESEVQVL